MRICIILNQNANRGRAASRFWHSQYRRILATYPQAQFCIISYPFQKFSSADLSKDINLAVHNGVDRFLSVGGDGAHNVVFNILQTFPDKLKRRELKLGFIPLGSSNDICKAFSKNGQTSVFDKIDFARAAQVNIGSIHIDGQQRFFLANASIGITAFANRIYNESTGILRYLPRMSVKFSILVAAIYSVFKFKSTEVLWEREFGEKTPKRVLNMGVVNTPFFGGDFRYPYKPSIGQLGLFYCGVMGWWKKLLVFFGLTRGQFPDNDERFLADKVRETSFESQKPFDIEIDGEVQIANHVKILAQQSEVQICPI